MSNFIIHDVNGAILRTGHCPDSMMAMQAQTGESVLAGSADQITQFISAGVVTDKPPKPSDTALFDYASKAWYEDAGKIREVKTSSVASLFGQKLVSNITYAGSLLDADATAQSNLKSKLQELDARIALSNPTPASQLLWKCADNTVVTFATQDEYRNWLLGYAIALSERGTALYMTKWQHQAAIIALADDVVALSAYDTTAGWPA